eukprot:scaffold19845_cov34-Attheya_sp.AAC.6
MTGEPQPNWLKHNRPPRQSEMSKPKMWKEFPYHWCCKETGGKFPGNWHRHQPSKCKGLAGCKRNNTLVKEPEGETGGGGGKPAAQKRKFQLTKAYAAIADTAGDGDESDK